MKIDFDQGVPVPLRDHLAEHSIDTAFELGWSQLRNGDLLNAAEENKYELLITTDQNLKYQQNVSDRSIAIVVLLSTSWPKILQKVAEVRQAVGAASPGAYLVVKIL